MEWNKSTIEKTFDAMMEIVREELAPGREQGPVLVLELQPGEYRWIKIPEGTEPLDRTPITMELIEALTAREEELIGELIARNETRVLSCLFTWSGAHPEIPSWHMRSRLIEINPENLQTLTFGWGGGEDIIVKPFSALLPPKK